jgi:thymidylate synthase
MKQIICDGFHAGWMELLEYLLRCNPVQPRGLLNREETCVSFRVNCSELNILVHPGRNLNYRFMVAEWIWYMRGWNDLRELVRFNPHMAKFSDDGLTLAGAYGPRLAPQWPYVLAVLLKDRGSRQSIATIFSPCPVPSKDIPCTLSLQFLIRENKLNLIVTMRSSDVWLGLPYDMFSFSQMQNALAGELKIERGWIQFNLGSSHLYQEHEQLALVALDITQGRLADPPTYYTLESPALPGWIPPISDLLLQLPWNYYMKIVNEVRTSAETLEILNEASK